jgi:hypothetical protein
MVTTVRRSAVVALLAAIAVLQGCGGEDIESDELAELDAEAEEDEEVATSESAMADSCNLSDACLDVSCEQYWDCTSAWYVCVGQRLARDARCVATAQAAEAPQAE